MYRQESHWIYKLTSISWKLNLVKIQCTSTDIFGMTLLNIWSWNFFSRFTALHEKHRRNIWKLYNKKRIARSNIAQKYFYNTKRSKICLVLPPSLQFCFLPHFIYSCPPILPPSFSSYFSFFLKKENNSHYHIPLCLPILFSLKMILSVLQMAFNINYKIEVFHMMCLSRSPFSLSNQ